MFNSVFPRRPRPVGWCPPLRRLPRAGGLSLALLASTAAWTASAALSAGLLPAAPARAAEAEPARLVPGLVGEYFDSDEALERLPRLFQPQADARARGPAGQVPRRPQLRRRQAFGELLGPLGRVAEGGEGGPLRVRHQLRRRLAAVHRRQAGRGQRRPPRHGQEGGQRRS